MHKNRGKGLYASFWVIDSSDSPHPPPPPAKTLYVGGNSYSGGGVIKMHKIYPCILPKKKGGGGCSGKVSNRRGFHIYSHQNIKICKILFEKWREIFTEKIYTPVPFERKVCSQFVIISFHTLSNKRRNYSLISNNPKS